MADPVVKLQKNGPIQVSGPVELYDHDGVRIECQKFPIFLCRCGKSEKKPFCDGTHNKIGFDGTCARQSG